MKNGRYFNFWDICDRNLWDAGYLAKEIQGYGILRPPLMAPQYLSNRAPVSMVYWRVIYEFFECSTNIPSGLLAYRPYKLVVYSLLAEFSHDETN